MWIQRIRKVGHDRMWRIGILQIGLSATFRLILYILTCGWCWQYRSRTPSHYILTLATGTGLVFVPATDFPNWAVFPRSNFRCDSQAVPARVGHRRHFASFRLHVCLTSRSAEFIGGVAGSPRSRSFGPCASLPSRRRKDYTGNTAHLTSA